MKATPPLDPETRRRLHSAASKMLELLLEKMSADELASVFFDIMDLDEILELAAGLLRRQFPGAPQSDPAAE